MKTSIDPDQFEKYLLNLLQIYIPDKFSLTVKKIPQLERTFERVGYCFSKIKIKYFYEKNEVIFDHINSDHMSMFLYFLSNTIWRETGDVELPTRFFYLNKIMHGVDVFYTVPMPDIFLFVHAMGSILGNAVYGDYLMIYQNCTVGGSDGHSGNRYPTLGEGVALYQKSSIIGNCTIGDNVVISANAFVLNTDVPANSLVVGQHPNCQFLINKKTVKSRGFGLS